MLAVVIVATYFLQLVFAKLEWSASHPHAVRRLQPVIATTHNDTSDPGCIVGGFDTNNPAKVYVGGPCSELTETANGLNPSANFRWIEMETLDLQLVDENGSSVPLVHFGTDIQHAMEYATHAEVGISVKMHVGHSEVAQAAVFAGTTSYLAKESFDYKVNEFVVDYDASSDTYTNLSLCVVKCCEVPPCDQCSSCPDAYNSSASPGMYKYSLLVSAYDEGNDILGVAGASYQSGPTGNGWERVVEDHGSGDPKMLSGTVNVYQMMDFTNMRADTLTVTSPDGTRVSYRNMEDYACDATGCTGVYSVDSITVASGRWTGTYTFPNTYNRGQWSAGAEGWTTSTSDTKIVDINLVKLNSTMLENLGLDASNKIVFLEYKFNASGVTANTAADGLSGTYMVYDPVVTTDSNNDGGGQTDGSFLPSALTSVAVVLATLQMQ